MGSDEIAKRVQELEAERARWAGEEPAAFSAYRKNDQGKPRMSLLPPRAMLAVGEVLTHGAGLYGADNWRRVDDPSRYLDALMRHHYARMSGRKTDQDSGLSHLAHLAANALMLLELELDGREVTPGGPR